MNSSLAIVIPAYKIKYFDAGLSSIAAQTNKNFKLYVCDDGSKEDIKSITDKYTDQLNIQYYRFPDNAGKDNLIKHWNRSVELADEEWIWLFSDDDIMSPGCVQAFFDALHSTKGKYNVYRFNIEMINAEGEVICIKEPHPQIESGYEFLQRRLLSKSLSAAVEYIFRKEVFEQNSGFVNFPLAYCSDDASWITFADDKDIYTIGGNAVQWRASGVNISASKGLQNQKAVALIKFVEFITKRYPDNTSELLSLAEPWFYENMSYIHARFNPLQAMIISNKIRCIFSNNGRGSFKKIIGIQVRNTRFVNKLPKWLRY